MSQIIIDGVNKKVNGSSKTKSSYVQTRNITADPIIHQLSNRIINFTIYPGD